MEIVIARVGQTDIVLEVDPTGTVEEVGLDGPVSIPVYTVSAIRAAQPRIKPIVTPRDVQRSGREGPHNTARALTIRLRFAGGRSVSFAFDEALETSKRVEISPPLLGVSLPGVELGWVLQRQGGR